ncbi:MAG: potassium-transporting ATPase subunit KdpA [Thermomicrobiales bacterium]
MAMVLQIVVYFGLLLAVTKPLGAYMYRLFSGERTLLSPVLRPVERGIYRLTGVDETQEMRWTTYLVALLLFNFIGVAVVYAQQRLQGGLPLNPQGLPGIEERSAFNTAVSFVTNTNWQGYYPEITMSYLTQMMGLAVHNFVSAATGIAIALALTRGFARRSTHDLGNFWVDLTRGTLYLLLPISMVFALVLVSRGVIQNFNPYTTVTTVSGQHLLLPQAPVASQEAIKMLGTNGGGILNANSSHPFENPTPLTNMLQMLSIFAIPAALTYTFGKMVGNTRQGWAIFATMAVLFLIGVAAATLAERAGNPLLTSAGADQHTTVLGQLAPGGNMEGKESRFGIAASALFAVITTAASCGAVNAMHDSFTPLGGMIPLANIGLGEVIFGGVGAGLYGILIYAVLAIFIAGLMVGRTPEYLGKKIGRFEVQMAMLVTLVLPLSILGFTAVAMALPEALASRWNPGAHGLSEILYAFTSATGNNGSAFAGISANTPFFNPTLGMAMLIGRFLMIVPIMALAGALAAKQRATETTGTFPTTGALWVGLLAGVILIVGALTYFPSYTLGPVVEHFQMVAGITSGL